MRRFGRYLSSHVITAVVVALVVGATTAVAAPTAVDSAVKFAKRATFAKKAARATRAKYAARAGKAKRATLALSAKVANNSALLGGHPASEYLRGQKIDFRAQPGTGETTLLDTGRFVLTASCDGTGRLRILGTTKVDHADIETLGNGGDVQDDDFNISDSPVNLGPTQGETRNIVYTERGGQTVTVHYLASASNYPAPGAGDPTPSHGPPLGGAVACLVTGNATVQ
ncbi:MAG TPA: hypothetical protein VH817_19970 [Thermoleophilaceae bacterium]|jgi:hypothetical protein